MNLGKHIHTLLKRQTEVYIAGLGSFKRVYSPASFDSEKNVFMPPISYIEFDSLSNEGYDFTSYLQQLQQIERSEAEDIIAQQVVNIQDRLSTSGEFSLDGLGQLVSYGNTAIFKPFDLSGFNFEPIEAKIPHEDPAVEKVLPEVAASAEATDTPEEEPEEIAITDVPIVATESPQTEEVLPQAESAEEHITESNLEKEEDIAPRNRSPLYGMVAALAVLLLGGLYYYSVYYNATPATVTAIPEDTITRSLAMATPLDTIESIESDTSLLDVDSLGLEDIVTTQDEEQPIEDHKKFTIVIGTHRTLAQAYEEAEAFNKDGHRSVRVVTPNLAKNLKQVIWDTYATKDERDSALRYVRKHIKTDAWPHILK